MSNHTTTPHEGNREQTPSADKGKARLERKLRYAHEEPDVVFIVPFVKPARFALVNMAMAADRIIISIKRQAGFIIPFEVAQELLEGFDELITGLWSYVHKVAPRLHSFDRRRWRDLNDTKEEKTNLAHRNISCAIVPRSEEAGQIAMAIKTIENRNLEIRQTASFNEIKEVVEDYCKILKDFDGFLKKTAETAQEEYRSALPKEEETEAQEREGRKKK